MTAGDTTMFVFLTLSLTFVFHLIEGGQLCGMCTQIADPRDCDVVSECGDHEECSIGQYVSPTGNILYDLGCKSTVVCPSNTGKRNSDASLTSRFIGTGNVMTCTACCNNTQICNIVSGNCNIPALDLTGSILCYNCDYMHSPGGCDRIRACSVHEQCYIGTRQSGLSGSLLWTSRCGQGTEECHNVFTSIPVDGVIGKRGLSVIGSECCKENFCNNKMPSPSSSQPVTVKPTPTPTTTTVPKTTQSSLSKPMIVYVTRPRAVTRGSYVHLTCRATGNPHPTISWSFFATGAVMPTNIRVANNNADIYIDSVTDRNYGHYACKARNSQGEDTRYIDILKHDTIGP